MLLSNPRWTTHSHARGTLHWIASIRSIAPQGMNTGDLSQWPLLQQGNWASVIEEGEMIHLITDVPRSFPLHYAWNEDRWIVSHDINLLIEELPQVTLRSDVVEEFRNVGNVFGNDTLLHGIRTARASSITTLYPDGRVSETLHTLPLDAISRPHDIDSFFDTFLQGLRERFSLLLAQSKGRQLLIPLSGGADSRLLLGVLKELNAPNVCAFTYGKKGTREALISEQVARACGYPWLFVEIDDVQMHAQWLQPRTAEFLRANWSGNALPHIQDWYALTHLTSHGLIDTDGIVLPGHTIVGNEHDEWAFTIEGGISREQITDILATKHYMLRGKPQQYRRDPHFLAALDTYLDLVNYEQGVSNLYEVTAILNILERQAKYINNSARSYEFFDLEWALPMIEPHIVQLWHRQAPLEVRDVARKHYIAFIDRYFREVTGVELSFFGGPLSSETSIVTRLVKKATNILHVRQALNNLYRAQVELNHPMGFHNLFTDEISRPQIARRLFCGEHILGVYADLFIRNQWTVDSAILPPARD